LWRLPCKLFVGRAAVKQFLARQSALDVETWPVREDFLGYLEKEAAAGRRIVLATAAGRSVGEAIARRVSVISGVMASRGSATLKGRAKADRLCQEFPDGFIYAGNSASDYHIWRRSKHNIVVNAPRTVSRRVECLEIPLTEFPRKSAVFSLLRRSLRFHQWAKNALIFVPLVLGGKSHDIDAWGM